MSYGRNAHKVFSARYELAQGRRVTVVSPTTEQARKLAESIDPRCEYVGLNDGKPLLGANSRSSYVRNPDRDPWLTPVAVFDSIAAFRNVAAELLLEVDRFGLGGKPA